VVEHVAVLPTGVLKRVGEDRQAVEGEIGVATGGERDDVADVPEDQLAARAVALNVLGRHLDRADRQRVIEFCLKADPARSGNAIAGDLKVGGGTVATVRRRLESTSQIPKSDKRRGRAGRGEPARPRPLSRTHGRPRARPAARKIGPSPCWTKTTSSSGNAASASGTSRQGPN
jgi:hypothetical protein